MITFPLNEIYKSPYYPAYKARALYKSPFSVFQKFRMDEPALYKAYIWALYIGWVPFPI